MERPDSPEKEEETANFQMPEVMPREPEGGEAGRESAVKAAAVGGLHTGGR